MCARRALGKHGGGGGLNRDDLHRSVLRFQVFAHAGDGAAGTHARDKVIYLTVGILPDFGAGSLAMRGGIGRVDELAGHKTVRDFMRKLFCLGDSALHALRAFGEHQLCAVGLHQLATLDGHGFRHDDDDPIAARCRNRGKTDAGVAGGRLNDDGAGLQRAAAFRRIDHRLGDTVLDRSCGIEIFQLGKNLCFEAEFLFDVGEFQQGGMADQLVGRSINAAHL